jgi:hypothetical protein
VEAVRRQNDWQGEQRGRFLRGRFTLVVSGTWAVVYRLATGARRRAALLDAALSRATALPCPSHYARQTLARVASYA